MIDKEMLEAMRSMFEPINTRLDTIDTRLDTLESGQEVIEGELQEIKRRVVKTEIVQENIISKRLDSIWEAVSGVQEKFDKLDRVEAVQEEHGHRIFALEQVVKSK